MLTRDQILKASDIVYQQVDVPEWNDFVIVKSLSGTEKDIYEQGLFEGYGEDKKINMVNARSRLCVLGIVDANHNRLLTDDDVAALGAHNGAILERIATVIRKLSGMDNETPETMQKNSGGGLNENSISV